MPFGNKYFNDNKKTSALLSATSLLNTLLPESQPYKNLFKSLSNFLNKRCLGNLYIGTPLELNLIKELGYGIDLEEFKNHISDNEVKTMSEDKFNFGFAVDLMRKDLGIAFDQAKDFGINLDVTKIVDQYYLELQKMGHNKLDTSSLVKRLTE